MELLIESCLRDVCRDLGRHLLGFDNPAINTGGAELSWAQFRVLMDIPVFRLAGTTQPVAYADVVASCSILDIPASCGDDAIRQLAVRIGGPAVNESGNRILMSWEEAAVSLETLIRVPAMRFYFGVEKMDDFESAALAIGAEISNQVVFDSNLTEIDGTERFRVMAMGQAVAGVVSYSMLRSLSHRAPFFTYQAEPYIGRIAVTKSGD